MGTSSKNTTEADWLRRNPPPDQGRALPEESGSGTASVEQRHDVVISCQHAWGVAIPVLCRPVRASF